MPKHPSLEEVSIDLLARVIGGQSIPWSGAPSPTTGQSIYTAPGMGIRDAMQGGAVSPNGGPTGGVNMNPGGGGGGGGGRGGFDQGPQALLM